MPFISAVGAAVSGTLEDFLEFYEPGSATIVLRPGRISYTLLERSLTNNDPVNRAAISNFLLDEGADPTRRDSKSGLSLVHILVARFRGHDPVARSDVELLRRLLDGGADPNAVDKKCGTLVQMLVEQVIRMSEESNLAEVYDVVFARDDLDLLKTGAFGRSSYREVWLSRDRNPLLWGYVQRWVADHGVVVPEEETRPR